MLAAVSFQGSVVVFGGVSLIISSAVLLQLRRRSHGRQGLSWLDSYDDVLRELPHSKG